MGTAEVNEMPVAASDEGDARIAPGEGNDGVDRLPDLVAALVTYANRVERLHARMRFSADQGERMMEQLGIRPAA